MAKRVRPRGSTVPFRIPPTYYRIPADLRAKLDVDREASTIMEDAFAAFSPLIDLDETSPLASSLRGVFPALSIRLVDDGSVQVESSARESTPERNAAIEQFRQDAEAAFAAAEADYHARLRVALAARAPKRSRAVPDMPVSFVDSKIRQHMFALNALPFVRRTVYSCAGYGPHGGNEMSYHDLDSDAHFIVEYVPNADWLPFHEALTAACRGEAFLGTPSMPMENTYRYSLDVPAAELPAKWAEVLAIVRNFLPKRHRFGAT